jgi:hemolysin activation/secretion protein
VTYRNPQFRVSVFNQLESSTTISSVPISGFRDFSKNTIGSSVLFRPILSDLLAFYHPSLFITAGLYAYRNDTLATDKRTVGNNKFQIKYAQTIDFWKFFHFNNSLQLQTVSSIVPLARNEFIFFGGLQSVRGFYELELEGKEIWILSNELEFKPIESLSLKILYDYANFVNTSKNYTHSIGFGFGLINNSNQLEIIVANGKLNDNPFALNGTKIHIGFKSNF